MATIQFREMKMEGGWLMLKPSHDSIGSAMAFIRGKKNRLYDCEIREHREKRSLDANAYAWVLLGKLAKVMHLPVEDVYRGYIKDLGDNYTPVCIQEKDLERFRKSWESHGIGWVVGDLGQSQVAGCHNLAAYYGSSVYSKETFCRFLDLIIQDCKAVGVETLTPEKLALMVEEWQ